MKRATLFISTAALMAGTACGVWAESNERVTTSFDRVERSVYDSNINYAPSPNIADEVGTLYSSASTGYASESDAYAPRAINGSSNTSGNTGVNTGTAGSTAGMGSQNIANDGNATTNSNRTITSGGNANSGGRTLNSGGNNVTGGSSSGASIGAGN
jgi:hypothetical protein